MTNVHDLLVAIDDQLTARVTRCTTCGRTPVTHNVQWVSQVPGSTLVVAAAQCARCVAADPGGKVLAALMRRRYDQQAS